MSIINYVNKEIQFKIVYYGPALCGKTTNLTYIHSQVAEAHKGELVSLATAAERSRRQGIQDQVPTVHGAGPGDLQRHAPTRAAQRRWCRVRRGFSVGQD